MRRKLLILGLLVILGMGGYVTWTLAGLPPVRYILRYGLAPGCEPTGQKRTVEGVEFVEIGPGIFRMGSDHLAKGGDWLGKLCEPLGLPWGTRPEPSHEMPVHWVEFRYGFWIARTEVTNAQFERFAPNRERSEFSEGDDDPVVDVSWEDAKAWCEWLSNSSELPVRLPSEAEWECACRAGSDTEFCFGNDEGKLPEYAWFYTPEACEVGTQRPNVWGLYDMHGNVLEWCEDTYHESYEGAPTDGSAGTEGGEEWEPGSPGRVIRGGGFDGPAENCRSAGRFGYLPANRFWYLGFRPSLSPPTEDR